MEPHYPHGSVLSSASKEACLQASDEANDPSSLCPLILEGLREVGPVEPKNIFTLLVTKVSKELQLDSACDFNKLRIKSILKTLALELITDPPRTWVGEYIAKNLDSLNDEIRYIALVLLDGKRACQRQQHKQSAGSQ